MTNVIGINGATPIQAGQPSLVLVEFLEEQLRLAQSGQIQGMATAVLFCEGGAGWSVSGRCGGLHMIGALEMCKAELAKINMEPTP
ncbi:hypothetical protein UFOVP317_2 [uncultured Caudovirales phage]|uniref:Uncharacterized protein n=1 Tax=uncultured Caudovirales phage TaxID=2100421 RepID=A0A6J5LTE7_9CAUD|nr:hypothetical protein UFOVP317_2 [uncultured Caudovirales phage]